MHSVAPLRAIIAFLTGHGAVHFIRWAVIARRTRFTLALFLPWIKEARLTRLRFWRTLRGVESWWSDSFVGRFWSTTAVVTSSTRAIWTWLTCLSTIESFVAGCAILIICCSAGYAVSSWRTGLRLVWTTSAKTTTRTNLSDKKMTWLRQQLSRLQKFHLTCCKITGISKTLQEIS